MLYSKFVGTYRVGTIFKRKRLVLRSKFALIFVSLPKVTFSAVGFEIGRLDVMVTSGDDILALKDILPHLRPT
jgi:hypothetical protein